MVKAKDFWKYICEDLGYRFFAGVPCKELKPLYDRMNSSFMHYIPAVRENVAVGLSNGVRMTGIKSGVIMDAKNIHNIMETLLFNLKYKIPVLIILQGEVYNKLLNMYKVPYKKFNSDLKTVKLITNTIEKKSIPGILLLEEGEVGL